MHEDIKSNCKVIHVVSFLQPYLLPFHYFTGKHSLPHYDVLSTLLYSTATTPYKKTQFLQASETSVNTSST